jgi:twitching motility protein PilT
MTAEQTVGVEAPPRALEEVLLAAGVVDEAALERARQKCAESGRWLGRCLLDLGLVTSPVLVTALARGYGLQQVDLASYPGDLEATVGLSPEECRKHLMVPLSRSGPTLFVAVANPADAASLELISAKTGLRAERMVASEREILEGVERIYARAAAAAPGGLDAASMPSDELPVPAHVDDLLILMMEGRASDLHLEVGNPPTVRIDGELRPLAFQTLTPVVTQELVYAILTDERVSEYEASFELDFAYSVAGLSRFRVNVHRQRGSLGAVFRAVPMNPPTLEDLKMPAVLKQLCHRTRGLVLVTGPTGHGKSTTLAAMIHEINLTHRCHIVTVEDPIEFLHRNHNSMIIQREVGADTHSFTNALRHVLRQDPDVILIGEMRDLETIAAAVTAAETGHLVFATLHTRSAAQTVDRIIDVFPPHQQQQIRLQLASVLEGIICQTLLPLIEGTGRVCAQEILIATPGVRNLIREGKSHQMSSLLQSGGQHGMQTIDQALKKLLQARMISREAALAAADDVNELQSIMDSRF